MYAFSYCIPSYILLAIIVDLLYLLTCCPYNNPRSIVIFTALLSLSVIHSMLLDIQLASPSLLRVAQITS